MPAVAPRLLQEASEATPPSFRFRFLSSHSDPHSCSGAAGSRFRVRFPGFQPRLVCPAACRAEPRSSGVGTRRPSSRRSRGSLPTRSRVASPSPPNGVPMRLFDVLPGCAAASTRRAGRGPGPVPGAAPAQPSVPRRDSPLPAGAALPRRRGAWRWGQRGLGVPRGLDRAGDRPGRPGLGQRRRSAAGVLQRGRPGC